MKYVRYIIGVIIMCFVIYVGVLWFKNRNLIEARADQTNLNNSVTTFLNGISEDNQYSMSGTMKHAQECAVKAANEAQVAQAAYVNAMEKDPPWYLEFTDGILWWDKKKVTKNEAADARFEMECAQYKYEQIRATDELFNKDKSGSLTIWDKIKVWFNNLLSILGLSRYNVSVDRYYTNKVLSAQDGSIISNPIKFILLLILIILLLLWLCKRRMKTITKYYKKKAKKKYRKTVGGYKSRKKNDEIYEERRKESFVMNNRSAFDDSIDMNYWLKSECDKAGVDMKQVLKMYGGRSDKAFIAMYNARMIREQSRRR